MTWLSDDVATRLQALGAQPDFSGTRYAIVGEIARGGMGIVYEAIDRQLQRSVALKVLPIDGTNMDAAERLRREAELIAGLEHPGIIPIHDAGVLPDGRTFYAMKLVRGTTLRMALKSRPGVGEVARLCVRICEPVAFAHSRGIAHGDLKPANVMAGEFGELLVMDWGVAIAGTPGYMAPEQETGAAASPRSDVFALGTMLHEMLTATERHLPRRLRAIIAKATARNADDRYPTARELSDDLVRFLDDQPVRAYPETIVDTLLRWLNRNRALLAIIAAYLVMRVLVLFFSHR